MFGVYVKNDDEMFLMNAEQVWDYLSKTSDLFQTYSVTTDGEKVMVYEPSSGANGKIGEVSLEEFYEGFDEDGLLIRPISNI